MLINTPSRYYNALVYLQDQIDSHNELNLLDMTVDTETTGLDLWSGDRLCGIPIECEDQYFYFPFRHGVGRGEINIPLERLEDFKELLSCDWVVYTGHNYKFDMQVLYMDDIPLPKRTQDTQLSAHLLNENEYLYKNGKVVFINGKFKTNYKLKYLADKYIEPGSSRESDRLEELTIMWGFAKTMDDAKGNLYKLPPEAVCPYAEQDVRLTKKLKNFHVPHLKNWKLYDIWQESNEYNIVATLMEIYGMHLDIPLMYEYMEDSQPKAQEYLEKLQAIAGYPLNPRSNPQMANLMGIPSTKKEIIETMDSIEEPLKFNPNFTIGEAVRTILAYRSYEKANVNYYEKFDRLKDWKDDIHTSIFMTGTISGRWSMGDPPMQAVPRWTPVYRVKDVFCARPGFTLVEADQGQAEMRIACHYAKEWNMGEKIIRGADIHTETADALGIPRDAAKRMNFGVIYGIGKKAVARQLHISEDLAAQYLAKYHGMYPGFRRLMKMAETMAEQRGYIRLWTGRVRHYDQYNETHKAMSNLVQGAVAEIIRHCILRNYRDLAPMGVRLLLQVHDSIVFEVPNDILFNVLPIINRNMTDFNFDIPLKVDIKYGERWGGMTKWEAA